MKLRLVLTLLVEGSTDRAFLGNVIPNTATSILKQYERQAVDVGVEKIYEKKDISSEADEKRIFFIASQLARELRSHHNKESITFPVLIIHCDADDRDNKRALHYRYLPGYNLVRQSEELERVTLLPVIPVHETEAWMLAAHHELLQDMLMTDMKPQELGLVSKVKQVESKVDPKKELDEIIKRARGSRSHRRYGVKREELYEPLGRRISLERLYGVPSYKQFVDDFTEALKALRLIQ
jgi:hypothetical protein